MGEIINEKPIKLGTYAVGIVFEGRRMMQGFYNECEYAVGDKLWVQEDFCFVADEVDGDWVDYRATPRYSEKYPGGWDLDPSDPDALQWQDAAAMPREFSRITLVVSEIIPLDGGGYLIDFERAE